jgi:hypothetical protein
MRATILLAFAAAIALTGGTELLQAKPKTIGVQPAAPLGTKEVGPAAAETSVVCGNTVYTISVGGGVCTQGNGKGNCNGSGGGEASATCASGCGTSVGDGSCKAVVK